MKWVYISGPISQGDPFVNVRLAIQAGERLRKHGFVPIIPHLGALWSMTADTDATYDDWIRYDLELLSRCDLLLRIPGPSKGADTEVARAGELGIPVYFDEVWLVEANRGRPARHQDAP